jgi:hypothetical protein
MSNGIKDEQGQFSVFDESYKAQALANLGSKRRRNIAVFCIIIARENIGVKPNINNKKWCLLAIVRQSCATRASGCGCRKLLIIDIKD